MAFRSEKEALQAKYLLGQLSEQERAGIEESYFADDNSFQELEIVEDELIDAYVHDELDPTERRQFEKLLESSSRLSERAQFARILASRVGARNSAQVVAPHVQPERSVNARDRHAWWQKIFAVPQAGRKFAFAGSAVMVLIAAALLFAWMQLRESSRRLERERVALQKQKEALDVQSSEHVSRINQLASDLERERNLRAEDQKLIESLRNDTVKESPPPSRVIASLFLTPGLTRDESGTGRTLTVRSGQSDVRLLLALPEDRYTSYRATVKGQDGEILHRDGLRARRTRNGNQIVFQFPAARVSSGDYIVIVSAKTSSGFEPVTDYAFRLVQAR